MKIKALLCTAATIGSWQVSYAQESGEAEASSGSRLDTIVVSAQRASRTCLTCHWRFRRLMKPRWKRPA